MPSRQDCPPRLLTRLPLPGSTMGVGWDEAGLLMGPGAQRPPHGGARGGPPEAKARPLTLLPACLPQCHLLHRGHLAGPVLGGLRQPCDFPCLKQLVAYVQFNVPGSDLERRAHLLLAQLEHAELTQAEPEGEEAGSGAGHGGAPEEAAGPGADGPQATHAGTALGRGVL